ncbi:hypothetical protein J6590_005256 [Homalodisca vitripennis]|nr:hypothetical protein J6590_005256 [Homalodisca vitripennis]
MSMRASAKNPLGAVDSGTTLHPRSPEDATLPHNSQTTARLGFQPRGKDDAFYLLLIIQLMPRLPIVYEMVTHERYYSGAAGRERYRAITP